MMEAFGPDLNMEILKDQNTIPMVTNHCSQHLQLGGMRPNLVQAGTDLLTGWLAVFSTAHWWLALHDTAV